MEGRPNTVQQKERIIRPTPCNKNSCRLIEGLMARQRQECEPNREGQGNDGASLPSDRALANQIRRPHSAAPKFPRLHHLVVITPAWQTHPALRLFHCGFKRGFSCRIASAPPRKQGKPRSQRHAEPDAQASRTNTDCFTERPHKRGAANAKAAIWWMAGPIREVEAEEYRLVRSPGSLGTVKPGARGGGRCDQVTEDEEDSEPSARRNR